MKVLVDAHLPQRLAHFLSSCNIDSKHTLELPDKNATQSYSMRTQRDWGTLFWVMRQ